MLPKNNNFTITNCTRCVIPHSLLERAFSLAAKHHTMEISLVFVGERAMKMLNKKWRGKDMQTNVLAFPLEKKMGEIFINPYEAEREAKHIGISCNMRIVYLFVHGFLHFQGYDHETEQDAKKMGHKEQLIMKLFSDNT